jgi:hypothetical protein
MRYSYRNRAELIFVERLIRKPIVAIAAIALVFSQTAPTLAFGLGGPFGERDNLRIMLNARIPLSASQADKDHAPSFGFTVQRHVQFDNPLYETISGSYQNSRSVTMNLMNLRFGTNGKFSNVEVGGFNALQFKPRLNAVTDENDKGGVPNWVWLVGGIAVAAGVVYSQSASKKESKCTNQYDAGLSTALGFPYFTCR